MQCLRRNSDVRRSVDQHPGDFAGAALVQHQMHIRKLRAEFGDDRQKRIARLGVGGCNIQRAAITIGELLAEFFDIFRIEQDAVDDLRQLLAGLRQPQKPLAATHEEFDAKLVLEVLDVLRNAGLGRIERVCNFGEIEVAPERFADDAELLKIHRPDVPFCSEKTRRRRLLSFTRCPVDNPRVATSAPGISTSK